MPKTFHPKTPAEKAAALKNNPKWIPVKKSVRQNGTVVEEHWRTYPDHTRTNNFSYPGNFNPNTGKITT